MPKLAQVQQTIVMSWWREQCQCTTASTINLNCLCGHSCIEAFLRVKLLQYNQVRIIVLSIYNDTVTPDMKINSLNCFMVHPSTPYYSGTPFENFGTPLGVQYTRLKSTALANMSFSIAFFHLLLGLPLFEPSITIFFLYCRSFVLCSFYLAKSAQSLLSQQLLYFLHTCHFTHCLITSAIS